MKVGDKVPVTIGAHQVAMAEVKELGDGEVSLIVPATLVRMGVRSELTDLPSTEPSTQTIIDGVDRPESATGGEQIVEVTSSTGETVSPAQPEAPAAGEAAASESAPTNEANDAGTAEVVAPVDSPKE